MKILFNTHPWAFQHPGGGEVIMEKLRWYLEQRGHEIIYFSFATSKLDSVDIIHHFSTLDTTLWHSYSLVDAPFVLTPTFWPRNSKWFIWLYNLKYRLKSWGGYQQYDLKYQMQFVDMLLPTTRLEGDRICNLLATSFPSSVLPNGVDIPPARTEENSFIRQYQVENYLLFVGNISPVKNLLPLIKTTERLGKRLVVIGGYSQEHEAYFQLCKKYASENTLFIGHVHAGSTLLHDAYCAAKVVIIPSDFETCSLVALEAGIRGVPVILTSRGGTKEIFSDHVWYIDPLQVEQWDKVIERCDREVFDVLRLQQFIKQHYSWEVIAERLEQIYNEVLTSNLKE